MKVIAVILCVYLSALLVQPVLFPLHREKEKVAGCCAGKDKRHQNCPTQNKGCCDDNQCNPFFSQCPLCAANAITVAPAIIFQNRNSYYTPQDFFSKDEHVAGQYLADLLRPPRLV